jgi:glycosyltransferase involved in cell wall biosynthesis
MSDSEQGAPIHPPPARPLRILIAHNVPLARTGGMSRLMGFIHDRVAARGHMVDYLCADAIRGSRAAKFARFAFPLLVLRHARAAFSTGRPYDLINVHEPSAVAILAGRRMVSDPIIVVTTHGVERRGWERRLAETADGREQLSLRTRMVYPSTILWQANFSLRRADHVFCLNEEDRGYITAQFGRFDGDVTRISPGADPIYAAASMHRDYARARSIVFAGTWLARKGVSDLAAAFVTLHQRYPQLELHVLGGGVADAVVSSAFPPEVRHSVKCIRNANDAEAAAAYANADIYLLPSRFEGTPLTLIEAMASGLPIVTTATCGMRDVIRDGANGLLIPMYSPEAIVDAVAKLIEDAAMRASLGRAARADALLRYGWDQVAAPVWAVYERLCGRPQDFARPDGSIQNEACGGVR